MECGQERLFEARNAEGKVDRLPGLAAELAQLKVSVILAFGTPASLVAKHATATIPIVVMAAIRLEPDSCDLTELINRCWQARLLEKDGNVRVAELVFHRKGRFRLTTRRTRP